MKFWTQIPNVQNPNRTNRDLITTVIRPYSAWPTSRGEAVILRLRMSVPLACHHRSIPRLQDNNTHRNGVRPFVLTLPRRRLTLAAHPHPLLRYGLSKSKSYVHTWTSWTVHSNSTSFSSSWLVLALAAFHSRSRALVHLVTVTASSQDFKGPTDASDDRASGGRRFIADSTIRNSSSSSNFRQQVSV